MLCVSEAEIVFTTLCRMVDVNVAVPLVVGVTRFVTVQVPVLPLDIVMEVRLCETAVTVASSLRVLVLAVICVAVWCGGTVFDRVLSPVLDQLSLVEG